MLCWLRDSANLRSRTSFSKALNRIDLGIAYATWSAVGIVATSIIAALAFGQKLTTAGVVGMGLILAGVVVVHLFGSAGH